MQRVADMSVAREKAGAAAIAVDRVSHVYDGRDGQVPALEDISLTVGAGRFTVIVGPSGCGKTSLLMMMAGLRHQSSGTIDCAGASILKPDPNRVGVVFQEASLFPWLTAIDNIEFPLALKKAHARRPPRARRSDAEPRRPQGIWRALSERTLGRHEAARLDRARSRARSTRAADGRTVRRPRRTDAHDHGPRTPAHLVGDAEDRRLHHPQSDGSRLSRRRSAGHVGATRPHHRSASRSRCRARAPTT